MRLQYQVDIGHRGARSLARGTGSESNICPCSRRRINSSQRVRAETQMRALKCQPACRFWHPLCDPSLHQAVRTYAVTKRMASACFGHVNRWLACPILCMQHHFLLNVHAPLSSLSAAPTKSQHPWGCKPAGYGAFRLGIWCRLSDRQAFAGRPAERCDSPSGPPPLPATPPARHTPRHVLAELDAELAASTVLESR